MAVWIGLGVALRFTLLPLLPWWLILFPLIVTLAVHAFVALIDWENKRAEKYLSLRRPSDRR